jgi:integral membrane sensor domain MASE1
MAAAMIIALYILVYAIVGLVCGRMWWAVCKRRDNGMADLCGIAGIIWPLMPFFILAAWLLDLAMRYMVIPFVLWTNRSVDRLVAHYVPAKDA